MFFLKADLARGGFSMFLFLAYFLTSNALTLNLAPGDEASMGA